MVAFRIVQFVLTSREAAPKRRTCVKLNSLWSNNLLSIFFTVLRGVFHFEIEYNRGRNVSTIQHQYRIYRQGLRRETVFRLIFTQMTETNAQPYNDLDFFRVMKAIKAVSRWPYELQNIFLKRGKYFHREDQDLICSTQ